MTNVRKHRHNSPARISQSAAARAGRRVAFSYAPLRARRLIPSGISLLVALCLLTQISHAKDFSFGRNPFSGGPSGAASEVVDVNAQGLGVGFRAGHVAGNTVGRDESATNVGLTPYVNIGDGLFFGDSRMTYANNGGLAWTLGTGVRHYVTAWDAVIGGYGYYDWDDITGADFKQWSVGAEILSRCWEARANVYRPYGDTSALTGSRADLDSLAYSGDRLLFDRIDTFAEALEGFDAEIGFLVPGEFAERFDLRAFGGGYQYEGSGTAQFSGFSTRLQADIGDWLELGLKLTDDDVFKTNVTFSAVVHFGGYHSQAHTRRSAIQRMAEPVRRNLNVVSTVSDVVSGSEVAQINDGGTVRDLIIAHVDSAAVGGTGTVGMPFSSINSALGTPADIVYTHAGSTFTTAPDNELTLLSGKTLLGEGVITTPNGTRVTENIVVLDGVGAVPLPASPKFLADSSLARPMLNSSAGTAVTMNSDSRLGGFEIMNPVDHGIFAANAAALQINEVTITNSGGNGIHFDTPSGTISIVDTEILSSNSGAFVVNGGDANISFGTSAAADERFDPSFARITNDTGTAISVQNTTGGTVDFTGATIDHTGGAGVVIAGTPGTPMAGNVTIDNLTIDNTGAGGGAVPTGVSITDAAGTYVFRNTLRGATSITGATNQSILVDSLGAGGQVQFGDVSVTGSGGSGLEVVRNSGEVRFNGTVNMSAFSAGTSSFVSVTDSTSTGSVEFAVPEGESLILNGAGTTGRSGIVLTGNASGSQFTTSGAGTASITSFGGRGIDVFSDASDIAFGSGSVGSLAVQGTTGEGIRLFQTTGSVFFSNDSTTVARAAGVASTANLVDIQENSGVISFAQLSATESAGNTGVFLSGNVAGANGNGQVHFGALNTNTVGGVGLMSSEDYLVRIEDGQIVSDTAAAIDIVNSGINITVERVDSTDSPTFGMRLENTNKTLGNSGLRNVFRVEGQDIPRSTPAELGTGGTIENAAAEGVLLVNAGQVSLDRMNILGSQYGIRVENDLTIDPDDPLGAPLADPRTDDDQFLVVRQATITDSAVRGIETLNLTEFRVFDSFFDNNGVTPTFGTTANERTNETIYVNYTQRPNDETTVLFNDFDNPFIVDLRRNSFVNTTDDTVLIEHTGPSTQDGAHIFVVTQNNDFDHSDDFHRSDGEGTRAFALVWDGPASVSLDGDDFRLTSSDPDVNRSTTAMYIEAESSTDQLLLTVENTRIPGDDLLAADQFGAIGLDVETNVNTNEFSRISVRNNEFLFEGEDSIGMQFRLNRGQFMELFGNSVLFAAQGGTGVDFTRIGQGWLFSINNNRIVMADEFAGVGAGLRPDDPPGEEGMRFRTATGPYAIQGLGNEIFEVFPNGAQNFQAPIFNSRPAAGVIQVNGQFYPQ